jgi:protein phosphatase
MFFKTDNNNKWIVIGDVHGCLDELRELISIASNRFPDHRFVFSGDITDRGPNSLGVINLVRELNAICVMGNHDDKLARYLNGNKIEIKHGLQTTVDEINRVNPDKVDLYNFISSFPIYVILDNGNLVVSHAGIKNEMIGREDSKKNGWIKSFCLYGDVTGKYVDGLPERRDWAAERIVDEKSPLIVYGHCVQKELKIVNKTCCVDTGAMEGGSLSALVYPEMEFVSVAAKDIYYKR